MGWVKLASAFLVGEIRRTICRVRGHLEQHLRDPDGILWDGVVGLSWLSHTRCPRCDGDRVGRVEGIGPVDARFAMTRERAARSWSKGWIGRDAGYVGELGAEVCAGCGFFEVFVRDPGMVQWDDLAGFTR